MCIKSYMGGVRCFETYWSVGSGGSIPNSVLTTHSAFIINAIDGFGNLSADTSADS